VAIRPLAASLALLGILGTGSALAQAPTEAPSTIGADTKQPPEGKPEGEIAACVQAAEEAQTQRSNHKLLAARTRLLACAQTGCPAVVRADCTIWLSDVERLLPTVVVSAKDSQGAELIDVRVLVDGELLTDRLDGLAQPVDPGIRLFRFERAGLSPVEQQVVVREGERGRRLAVLLSAPEPPAKKPEQPPPSKPYPPIPTYVFGGIGVAALGSFAYFGLKGTSKANELEDTCGKTKSCTEEQVSPAETQLLVADISLAVGLVAIGTAVYFLIAEAPAKKKKPSVQTELLLAPGVGRISVSAPF
jgi:hypothetical protein